MGHRYTTTTSLRLPPLPPLLLLPLLPLLFLLLLDVLRVQRRRGLALFTYVCVFSNNSPVLMRKYILAQMRQSVVFSV